MRRGRVKRCKARKRSVRRIKIVCDTLLSEAKGRKAARGFELMHLVIDKHAKHNISTVELNKWIESLSGIRDVVEHVDIDRVQINSNTVKLLSSVNPIKIFVNDIKTNQKDLQDLLFIDSVKEIKLDLVALKAWQALRNVVTRNKANITFLGRINLRMVTPSPNFLFKEFKLDESFSDGGITNHYISKLAKALNQVDTFVRLIFTTQSGVGTLLKPFLDTYEVIESNPWTQRYCRVQVDTRSGSRPPLLCKGALRYKVRVRFTTSMFDYSTIGSYLYGHKGSGISVSHGDAYMHKSQVDFLAKYNAAQVSFSLN